VLKALTEDVGRDLQGVSRLWPWHVQNLAEYVREAMRPIQALEHAERASNFHLLNQERPFGVRRPVP
jgi:hypothetical protein